MTAWQLVKHRTAADGAVWRSMDGQVYKRTGGPPVEAEARCQRVLAGLGYPVPDIVDAEQEDGVHYFIERSAGSESLHELAMRDATPAGNVAEDVIDAAIKISARLLEAQARSSLAAGSGQLREWFERAGYTGNVFGENPDFDTPRVRTAINRSLHRLRDVPFCRSHLDYGLPNAFPDRVIDWQHHGMAPVGYDVYSMLEIAAFKGGNRGYRFTPEQCSRYIVALDETSKRLANRHLSGYLGEFLWVKCFFFLALMRPSDAARRDKYVKWRYRRELFETGLEQYESTGAICTDTFPALDRLTAELAQVSSTGPRP